MVAIAAVVAAAAVGWAVSRVAGGDDDPPAAAPTEPGVSHVHGLGINPADGSLIVATHFGSFRIPADSDRAVRIGHSFQDTMGFTVAGANHFLGSGHPDLKGFQAGQPSRLGLIESTNAGATWRSISLGGEADFHGLAFAHDRVYGWDSGTGGFMVSTDNREWETRSTLQLFSFAVDPEDAEHVVGAGPEGLTESSDGGRTWASAPEGPKLVTLSWDGHAGLWGADAEGGVWERPATEWSRAGELPGEPQAFLATPDALHAAAFDGEDTTGVYRSTDGGRTWELRYRDRNQ